MAGLDAATGYQHQFPNDVIVVSNDPINMAGSNPAMTPAGRYFPHPAPLPYPTTIAFRMLSGAPTPTRGSKPEPVPRISTVP